MPARPVTAPALTKRQQRALATGEQLLAAARETFETAGYAATTVGAITRNAGTAHGTFYLHFKNKEEAFARVVASVLDEIYVAAQPAFSAETPQVGIRTAMRAYLDVFLAHRGLWRALLEGLLQSKAIEAMWREVRRPFVDEVARAVRRVNGTDAGRGLDPEEAAAALCSMCEWYAFTSFVLDDDRPPSGDLLDRAAATLADLWYHGVYDHAALRPPV